MSKVTHLWTKNFHIKNTPFGNNMSDKKVSSLPKEKTSSSHPSPSHFLTPAQIAEAAASLKMSSDRNKNAKPHQSTASGGPRLSDLAMTASEYTNMLKTKARVSEAVSKSKSKSKASIATSATAPKPLSSTYSVLRQSRSRSTSRTPTSTSRSATPESVTMRSSGIPRRLLNTVEVQGRKLGSTSGREKSPYACKVTQLPTPIPAPRQKQSYQAYNSYLKSATTNALNKTGNANATNSGGGRARSKSATRTVPVSSKDHRSLAQEIEKLVDPKGIKSTSTGPGSKPKSKNVSLSITSSSASASAAGTTPACVSSNGSLRLEDIEIDEEEGEEDLDNVSRSSSFHTAPMLLKNWPNFTMSSSSSPSGNPGKSKVLNLIDDKNANFPGLSSMPTTTTVVGAAILDPTNNNLLVIPPENSHIKSKSKPTKIPKKQDTSAPKEASPKEEDSSSSNNAVALLQTGIVTAHEVTNVLLHTVFKAALGSPSTLSGVLEIPEFLDFLHAPNEVEALVRSASILSTCGKLVDAYVQNANNEGLLNIDFPKLSANVTSILQGSKWVKLIDKDRRNSSPFSLTFSYNPESNQVLQTVGIPGSVFRTSYATSPFTQEEIRAVLSSHREQQVGIGRYGRGVLASGDFVTSSEAFILKPDSLLESIVKSTSLVHGRLTKAHGVITKLSRKLAMVLVEIEKPKYSPEANPTGCQALLWSTRLNRLQATLRRLNVAAGILFYLSKEFGASASALHSVVWNTYVKIQEVLKFPQMGALGSNKLLPPEDLVSSLTEGIKGVDYAVKVGEWSLGTSATELDKGQMSLIALYLDGIKSLGVEKNVDFGSLLATLVASIDMLGNKAPPEEGNGNLLSAPPPPPSDTFIRTAAVSGLGKLNWAAVDLLGIVKKVDKDAHLLAIKTCYRLREVKKCKDAM